MSRPRPRPLPTDPDLSSPFVMGARTSCLTIRLSIYILYRPRGKRTNERGAKDLLFVPLTLGSPFACRSRVTSRDPFQREILLAR